MPPGDSNRPRETAFRADGAAVQTASSRAGGFSRRFTIGDNGSSASLLLAGGAYTGNLDHRSIDREAEIIGFREQSGIVVLEFRDPLTGAADQKARAGTMPRVDTGDKSVEAFDAMDQAFRGQEFEGPINDRWRDALARGCAIELVQNIVGAHRLVAAEQNFEHLAAPLGEPDLAVFTKPSGLVEQLSLAAAVIVIAKSDIRCGGFVGHGVTL